MAMGMPEKTSELKSSYYWMYLLGLQIPFQILVLILTTFVYVEEPIDFSVKKGDKENAMKLIAKVYSPENELTHE